MLSAPPAAKYAASKQHSQAHYTGACPPDTNTGAGAAQYASSSQHGAGNQPAAPSMYANSSPTEAFDAQEFAAPPEEAQDSAALVDAGIQEYEQDSGHKKAKELWQRAAEMGSKEALHNLGVYYIHKGKVDKAMKFFTEAAAMGLGAAYCSLGKLYMYGLNNVEQDVEKGIRHYEAACQLGEKSAHYYLGVYWLYQGDNKRALTNFEKLSLTYQNTAYYRGIIYCMIAGSGQYHKYQEAIHCLETACSLGSAYAHYTLAIMHYMGIGVKRDVVRGLKMLHAAAEEMDVTEALVELAHIYCSGCTLQDGGDEDAGGGGGSINNNNNNNNNTSSSNNDFGSAGDSDIDAAGGSVPATDDDAHQYPDGSDVSDAGSSLSAVALSGVGTQASSGKVDSAANVILQVNHEKANSYLMRAAQKGSAEAMHFLAYNYEKGFGFEINFEDALYWYQQAAKLNYQASVDRLNEFDE